MRWLKRLNKDLTGLSITEVRYDRGGYPVIELSDGSSLIIQSDDEGNGPGVAMHEPSMDQDCALVQSGQVVARPDAVGTWQIKGGR